MTNPTPTPVRARDGDAAAAALDATTHAIERSRQIASDAAASIGETARDLRDGASDLARSGAEAVSDATVAAQRQLGRYATATRRQVAQEPVKSVLIAAGIGAAAVALYLAMSRSRSDGD